MHTRAFKQENFAKKKKKKSSSPKCHTDILNYIYFTTLSTLSRSKGTETVFTLTVPHLETHSSEEEPQLASVNSLQLSFFCSNTNATHCFTVQRGAIPHFQSVMLQLETKV